MNARLMRGMLSHRYKTDMESYGSFGEKGSTFRKKGRFKSLKNTCRLEEYLSLPKKGRISRTAGKSSRTCSRFESISHVVNAKLVTKDGTIPNPFNLHSDFNTAVL